ncbi:MAG: glucosyltransferase domain-containing protein [Acutalibacteraceae bacterium]
MGLTLKKFYDEKIKSEWKSTFYITIIIGLFVHIYKFTNNLPIHDSLLNYYDSQNIIGSGRWFLSVACAFSSFFDLPWIDGLFTVILTALTAVVIVDIFKINNSIIGGLIGGILITFPSMTEILFFEYTADGYAMAMLFSALAVRLSLSKTKPKLCMAFSAVLICLCCAIYQAYVSFGLMLVLSYFVLELLRQGPEKKSNKAFIFKQIAIYAVGLILFYVIWKLLLVIENHQVNDYQGISSMKLSVKNILTAPISSLICVFKFLFGNGLSAYTVLNIVFFVSLCVVTIFAIIKSKIYKNIFKTILLFLSCAVMPIAICVWYFTTNNVFYSARMLHSVSVLLILFILLCEEYCKDFIKNIVLVFLIAVIANNAVIANINYYYLDNIYESTYATVLEMVFKIKSIDEESSITKICPIGKRDPYYITDENSLPEYAKGIGSISRFIKRDLIFEGERFVAFANHTFNYEYTLVDNDTKEKFEKMDEVKEMEAWPGKDSIRIIDDTIVIKFADVEDEEDTQPVNAQQN